MENMYNLNIERMVLSSIIFDPATYGDTASNLKSHDFYLPFHQHLFGVMATLTKDEKPIEEEFIRGGLNAIGKFDEVAMLDVLSANSMGNVKSYLAEIKAKSSKRALATLATEIKKVVLEDDLPAEEVQKLIEKKIAEINANSVTDDFFKATPMSAVKEEEMDFLTKDFIPLPKKVVTFITAKGGTGKSFILLQVLIRYLSGNPTKRAYAWLSEDVEGQSRIRANGICRMIGADASVLDRLDLLGAEKGAKHLYTEKDGITTDFHKFKMATKNYDIVVLDPLIGFFGGNENDNSQAKAFVGALATWAVQENKALVVVHHVNKQGGSRGASAFGDACRLEYVLSRTDEVVGSAKGKETLEVITAADDHLFVKIGKDNYHAKGFFGFNSKQIKVFPKIDASANIPSNQDYKVSENGGNVFNHGE